MRFLFRLIGLCVLIAALFVGGLLLLPKDRIAAVASSQLSALTRRDVRLGNELSISFWPVLGVRTNSLQIANPDWAGADHLLSTGSAAIGVAAAPLLQGAIEITHVEAQSPTLWLETRDDGATTWDFSDGAPPAPATQTPSQSPEISFKALSLTDAAVVIVSPGTKTQRISDVDVTLDWPDPAGAATIAVRAAPAGRTVSLDAEIAGFGDFIAGGVQPVTVNLATNGGTVALKGRAATEGAFAGNVALKLDDTGAFLSALGAPAATPPDGLGRSVTARADVTLTPDNRIALREMTADLGGNKLAGGVDLDFASKPRINAQLTASALDLRSLTGADAEAQTQTTAGSGWPTSPIDASFLASFDGAISLRAPSIDLGALTLGASHAVMTNDRARMVFDLRQISAYDGTLSGEFVMNNRSGLSVGGKLRADGVKLNPMLSDLADITRFTGTGAATLNFLAVGETVDQLMRSLKGDGTVSVGRGTIEGIDLDNILGSFDVAGGTTVFDSLGGSYTIDAGVLRNDDLAMVLPNVETTGAGAIDLGGQQIDYTVTPKALRVNEGRGLAVPVRISGPWASPRIQPDVSAAIDLNFQEEKDRVEERVRQKVDEKITEELGVVREDGQSVEEAIKDGLEDKLKREFLRLFD